MNLYLPNTFMINFQKSNSFRIDNLGEKDTSMSTLLIPAHLLEGLISKNNEHGKKTSKNNLRLKVSLTLKRFSQDFASSYHVRV